MTLGCKDIGIRKSEVSGKDLNPSMIHVECIHGIILSKSFFAICFQYACCRPYIL